MINNLVVPSEHKHQFEVVAGGRRLKALQALVKAKTLTSEGTVECLVVSGEDGNAEAISLSENIYRQAMHPAAEVEAFQTLIDAVLTVVGVANQFGTTQAQVNKRLKLAGVAPQILAAYRKGELDLDCVMAFTLEAEHKRQRRSGRRLRAGTLMPAPSGARSPNPVYPVTTDW